MRRRDLIAATAAAAFCAPAAWASGPVRLDVFKTPWCGCCGGWIEHMRREGFAPVVTELEDLAPVRARHGVADSLASCHTSVVSGYAVEGHVPAPAVRLLLQRRPRARGLALPGMPIGSPGMEVPGRPARAYDVLLIARDGSTSVFFSSPAG